MQSFFYSVRFKISRIYSTYPKLNFFFWEATEYVIKKGQFREPILRTISNIMWEHKDRRNSFLSFKEYYSDLLITPMQDVNLALALCTKMNEMNAK